MCARVVDVAGLHEAIENDRLSLRYQPQVTADGSEVLAVEALARWPDADGDGVVPLEFVAFAERNDLIDEFGAWVLRRACRDGACWPGLRVAVNVSPRQFRRLDFVAVVAAMARTEGMPCDRLELEITESVCFDDLSRAAKELQSLRDLGMRIALDDFGTGCSSLSVLQGLPLDKIKIDKSFVAALDTAAGAAAVDRIVALAHARGLEVTAEGVETTGQRDFLREIGCDFLQGHLYWPALNATEISEILMGTRRSSGPRNAKNLATRAAHR